MLFQYVVDRHVFFPQLYLFLKIGPSNKWEDNDDKHGYITGVTPDLAVSSMNNEIIPIAFGQNDRKLALFENVQVMHCSHPGTGCWVQPYDSYFS